jgi:hypothetical protein
MEMAHKKCTGGVLRNISKRVQLLVLKLGILKGKKM